MALTRLFSLAQLIALRHTPPQLVQLAARTGYQGCGVRIQPAAPGGVFHDLCHDATMLRETLAAMRDTGVRVLDIEIIRIGESFDARQYEGFMAMGAQLNAKNVLVAGDDSNLARVAEHLAALCEVAAPYHLTCDVEAMPWCGVASVQDAAQVVALAARPNAGVLVDAIHYFRHASNTLTHVQNLPRSALNYAQVCDAFKPAPTTTEGLIHDARCERQLPGAGHLDLKSLFNALPADLPISVEVPNDKLAPAMGYEAWARAALVATQAVLGKA